MEHEVAPRIECIEQQIPTEWKEFAGKPMQVAYYATKVNTFRENPELQRPSESFSSWAVKKLRREMGEYVFAVQYHHETNAISDSDGRYLSDEDLRNIVAQEWRTDLTRSIIETRLNRHGSKDGPVVRRSPSGVLYVSPQPSHSNESSRKFVQDAIATPGQRKKKMSLTSTR
ncbi:hypothetical protein DVH05_023300 [Phytophthora capsici]|nr:hypothetical protein DVH05_023300 [Phytophthora capsici]